MGMCIFDVTESPVSPAGLGNYCCFFTFVFFLMSPVSLRRGCIEKKGDVYFLMSPSHH